ncbi:MAG: ammonium transporter [Verrucomicrobiota bacterium JB024]|nr:ammonium transporter [Verrucomicrobiota bacterium JB024]
MATPAADFFTISNLWLLIAAGLVFIMHLGFSTVETGLTQSKNTVNILFKNVFIVCMGVIVYALWGFNSMYPGDFNGFFAMGSPIANGFDSAGTVGNMTDSYAAYTYWTDFIFQAMFAATAATIVSGAVAERIKLAGFMVYATILVCFVYPITGSWEWGGGWLDAHGFADFAGSSLVHAFGGYSALAAVILLGARKGKYVDGKIKPILGHSMPLATIGVFMLFFGWFGFNGGSVLSADPQGVSFVFVTTTLAGCAGGLGGMFTSWILLKKPDLSMGLNGILAGLVGITAGADVVSPWGSVVVGILAGIIVVIAVLFFDKIKIDDPVGAISVHGICGNWGTLCVALFGGAAAADAGVTLTWQFIGTAAVSIFAFICSFIIFGIVKAVMGVRVSEEEEFGGLDVGEHGQEAYPDFAVASKG